MNISDGILYGGTLEDIRMTKKSLSKTLFREIAQMMEIQFFVTVLCATFLGNYLNRIGLDQEQTSIFRILCFGYCLFGLAKCLIILLLYFEDRAGALIGVMCFAGLSALFTWLFLKTEVAYWGSGFLAAAFVTAMYGAFRIRYFLDRLEYKVFLRQPLFYEEKKGVFTDLAEMAGKQEAHFKAEMEKRYQDKFEKRRQRRLRSRSLP